MITELCCFAQLQRTFYNLQRNNSLTHNTVIFHALSKQQAASH